MTDRASGRAARRRRPLARAALLAVPGGMMVGGLIGVEYSLVYTVVELLLSPAWAGGTGSVGLSVFGALIGLAVGVAFGFVVGSVTAAALAVAWAVRAPRWATTLVGCATVTVVAIGFVGATISWDAATLLIPLWGSAHGVAGVVLVTWVAGLRPRDYDDILEARWRASVRTAPV